MALLRFFTENENAEYYFAIFKKKKTPNENIYYYYLINGQKEYNFCTKSDLTIDYL